MKQHYGASNHITTDVAQIGIALPFCFFLVAVVRIATLFRSVVGGVKRRKELCFTVVVNRYREVRRYSSVHLLPVVWFR